jgi:hypothetical protein
MSNLKIIYILLNFYETLQCQMILMMNKIIMILKEFKLKKHKLRKVLEVEVGIGVEIIVYRLSYSSKK